MPFASDTFAGVTGTVLETYSANWTKVAGDDGDVLKIGTGSFITTTTSIGFQAHIWNAAQATNADYDVEGTYLIAAGGDLPPAIAGRIVSAADSSCYFVTWLGGGTWGLYRHTGGGGNTQIGTYVGDSPNGVQRTVTLQMRGTTITVLIGGVSRISVTDATYAAKGYAGVVQYFGTVADSANLRNWSASNSAATPTITSVSSATPREGASLTITGTSFGASQGSGDVKINGVAQTVTSWSDTSIAVTIVLGTNKFGAAYTVVVRDNSLTSSNSYAGITGLLPANSGLSYVDIGTPNTTSAYRLTSSADLVSGDQIEYQNMSSGATVNADATFSAAAGVSSFNFRVWTSGSGYGASATQVTTLGGGVTDKWQIRPFNKRIGSGF